MTPEEVKAILQEMLAPVVEKIDSVKNEYTASLKSTQDNILAQVDAKNSGLASYLTKQKGKGTDDDETKEDSKSKLSLQSLQSKLDALEAERTKDKETLRLNRRDQVIKDELIKAGAMPEHVLSAYHLYLANNSDIQEEDNIWFAKQGEKVQVLSESVKNYLNSSEGKLFLPPSKTKGSNIKESTKQPAQGSEKTLNELLFVEDF